MEQALVPLSRWEQVNCQSDGVRKGQAKRPATEFRSVRLFGSSPGPQKRTTVPKISLGDASQAFLEAL
jgi:hypothetical protein